MKCYDRSCGYNLLMTFLRIRAALLRIRAARSRTVLLLSWQRVISATIQLIFNAPIEILDSSTYEPMRRLF